jgi:hypothetical protein
LGVSRIEQEQPEEATQAFTDLVRNMPNSEFTPKAKEYLEKLGKPIPEPANNDPAPPRPGMMGRVGLILGRNDLTISKDGVLISSEGDQKEEATQTLQKPEEASGSTSSVRARVINPNAGQNTAPANGNGSAGTTEAAPNGAPAATPATAGSEPKKKDDKKNDKKDDKKDDKKNDKKKKGFLGGIFR